ncbi:MULTISPECIES: TM2 domain-containing protein [unclassified Agarivorans]|uniref:TM2 domain-containing protein n=2 Tax=unclassified Agarivorans TaxID=2636026 RepID=UPI003D7E4530
MTRRDDLEVQQEQLRAEIRQLPAPLRQQFYQLWEKQVKDPDSYAVLNYLFIAGLHHFYLGKWQRGLINLTISLMGLSILFSPYWIWGVSLLLLVSLIELPALFRAELILLEHNNKSMQTLLKQIVKR